MDVQQYRIHKFFIVGDNLIQKDSIIYISESYYYSDRDSPYRKVFNYKYEYVGEISESSFYSLRNSLTIMS